MKETLAKILFLVIDLLVVAISIGIAFYLRQLFSDYFQLAGPENLFTYLNKGFIYGVIIIVLFFEGIYTKRFDFWQEHKQISRSLAISCLIVLSVLALQHESEYYSRFILIVSFFLMFILLPIEKFLIKRLLYKMGLWRREAFIFGKDPFFEKHVFENPYLGYIKGNKANAKTFFVASDYRKAGEIETILNDSVKRNKEVIFIPLIKSYDFTDSYIIHLFNAQANLIVLENKLLSHFNQLLKKMSDLLLSLLLLIPVLIIIIPIVAAIKREEPYEDIVFKQIRMGRGGKLFVCYKFRTMREDSDSLLEAYLQAHPEEIDNYAIFHKYDNDPRITRIGRWLRKTSLDELPQIFNVLKGEMSLIGPRPYMIQERHKMGDKRSIILAVKPGITGLWQVSGRSELNFSKRIELDMWYVRNWSLWTDFVILMKTIKVVLQREGAV